MLLGWLTAPASIADVFQDTVAFGYESKRRIDGLLDAIITDVVGSHTEVCSTIIVMQISVWAMGTETLLFTIQNTDVATMPKTSERSIFKKPSNEVN